METFDTYNDIQQILAGKKSVPVEVKIDIGSALLLTGGILLAVFIAVSLANMITKN